MTDSIDKKLNEKRDNLDAMLDEADSSSFLPTNGSQDDEDTIDRLLMNADFDDDDDTLIPTEANKDVDELDDFLSFDDFGTDFNEPEIVRQDSPRTAAVETEQPEQAVGSSSFAQSNEPEGGEDALDRMLMSVEFDADTTLVQSNGDVLEALTQAEEPSSAVIEDEFDDSFGLSDAFDEADMIQEDGFEVSAPEDVIVSAVVKEPSMEVDAVVNEVPDDFSDFSDFIEADMTPSVDAEKSGPATVDSSSDDVAELSDDVDDFSGVDFDESDLIRDDEVESSADLVAPNEQLADDNDDLLPDAGLDTEGALAQADEKTEVLNDDAALSDELDDFVGYGDDFDASGLIQDDENGFANLFADAGSDSEGVSEQTGEKNEVIGDDSDLSKIDNFFQLDEVSGDFSKETEETQLADTNKFSTEEDDFLLPDFDITTDTEVSETGNDDTGIQEDEFADAFGDTDFLNEDATMPAFEPELQSSGNEAVESKPKQTIDTEDAILSPFGFEREDIKKQLKDAENNVKKAKIFGYVALGFGVVTLSVAAALGVMTYSAKTEVSKLTENVSSLEADLEKMAANNPNAEINAMVNSVVQLNQQVYGFITELKGNPEFPVDLLTTKVPDIAAKQDRVSKALDMLQAKIGDSAEKVSLAPFDVEVSKMEVESAPVKEAHVQKHESTKKESVAHESAPIRDKAMHETAPAKAEVVVPAKVKAIPKAVPAKMKAKPETVTAKPVYATKSVIKQDARRVIKQEVYGKWGVNLIAFKQEWFAKSKAAEFARLGVIAEVVPVREKNVTMYRLRAGGFKSKAEAVSNTAKLKKALNLDSVWVSDN